MTRIAVALLGIMLGSLADAAAQSLPDFTLLVRKHGAAVVNISTLPRVRTAPSIAEAEAMSGDSPSGPSDETSLGSGIIVSSDGYILTCAHVVAEAREIVVRLIDRREFNARLVGSDMRTDVALLKIEAGSLPAAIIGNPAKLQVGEWVLAIGSPFGFQHSATSGIVSAKGRSLPQENYTPFIQTDVAINPGNSGGPLFNLRGETVGINSQIFSRNGGFMGVSFAIPIDLAMRVAEQLKQEGRSRRGWLGVSPQEVTRGLAGAYGLDKPRGALIADILPESPAARSELRAGDIVLEYDDKPIEFSADLPMLVGQTAPRTRVKLRVYRRGAGARELQVMLGELQEQAPEPGIPERLRPNLLLAELTERQRREEGLTHGVVIEGLDAVTRQTGLLPGDIVTEVDGKHVQGVSELRRMLARVPPGAHAVLRVRRGLQALYVAILPGG